MEDILCWVGGSLIQWACSVVVALPFVLVAIRSVRLRERNVHLGGLLQLSIFFLVSLALTRLDQVWVFIRRPWQAMVLEAAWALVFIFVTRSVARAGLTLHTSIQAWRDSLVITGLMLLFVMARSSLIRLLGIGQAEPAFVVPEYLFYQLTMPGIAEELGYRGVIQPGLNESFGPSWKLLGARVGWGWVITSVIFWAPHAFHVDSQMHLSFHWPTLTIQLIAGFVFGWIRERTDSVFPSVLAHNFVNVVWTLI